VIDSVVNVPAFGWYGVVSTKFLRWKFVQTLLSTLSTFVALGSSPICARWMRRWFTGTLDLSRRRAASMITYCGSSAADALCETRAETGRTDGRDTHWARRR